MLQQLAGTIRIPRRTYYYWHSQWIRQDKTLTSLYDLLRSPKSHISDANEELVCLVVQLRLDLGYGKNAFAYIIGRGHETAISLQRVHNILSRAELLEKRRRKTRKNR